MTAWSHPCARTALALAAAAVVASCAAPSGTARSTAAGTPAGSTRPAASSSPAYPLGLTLYPVPDRQRLPPLAGTTLTGERLDLTTLRGRALVLNVWASWCIPCRAESPALAGLAARTGPAVRFVGVDEGDTGQAATAFLRTVGSRYPHLVDSGPLLSSLRPWLPAAVPGTLVVDPQGRVAARVVGPVTADQVASVLAGLR